MKNVIELGDQVKSRVTGFEGIAVARLVHLNGCDRILIQPKVQKDQKMPESYYVDLTEVDIVKKSVAVVPTEKKHSRGGQPSRHS